MKCESCGREGVQMRAVCMYCGGKLKEVKKSEVTIRCPKCNDVMVKKEKVEITLDHCGSCNGTWYDKVELEVLLQKSKSEIETPNEQNSTESAESIVTNDGSGKPGFTKSEKDSFFRQPDSASRVRISHSKKTDKSDFYRKCPVCKTHMGRVNFLQKTGVVVDVCTQHGIFLDDGEFDSLHHFIQTRLWL
jgi:Zn-finger nucleic acid-binding protein